MGDHLSLQAVDGLVAGSDGATQLVDDHAKPQNLLLQLDVSGER